MWFLFAGLYYAQSLTHGDWIYPKIFHNPADPWPLCIANAHTFTDFLIYSFETQSTVGYGYRYMNDECLIVVALSMIQIMLGLATQGLLIVFMVNKFARPTKRVATLMFSNNAVIAMRDGKLCLMIRVGDMRKTCLAEAHVRIQLIQKRVTKEGNMIPYHQSEMDVGFENGRDRVIVMWPITVIHEINETSPLYEFSKRDLADPSTKFEIIVMLEGVVESNGCTAQARTSYIPREILWGKRFDRVATYGRRDGVYLMNMAKFSRVVDAMSTPSCSAKQLDEMQAREIYVPPHVELDLISLMNQTTIHDAKEIFKTNLFGRTTVKTVFEISDDEVIHDDTDSESHDSTEYSSDKSSLEDVTDLQPLSLVTVSNKSSVHKVSF
ncbi:hypothetical protein L596_006645 [Steinernema carpocapsae]|uniref:Inward rectifier potassium channel C-terminal domain-containing protein n=1 Tax=Steinernema carpocapsae TaxID=34508 RepID=A0A4U8VC04_STECR|nr:hypothetical protein L596_006645 [Steinernema carpocapsae]